MYRAAAIAAGSAAFCSWRRRIQDRPRSTTIAPMPSSTIIEKATMIIACPRSARGEGWAAAFQGVHGDGHCRCCIASCVTRSQRDRKCPETILSPRNRRRPHVARVDGHLVRGSDCRMGETARRVVAGRGQRGGTGNGSGIGARVDPADLAIEELVRRGKRRRFGRRGVIGVGIDGTEPRPNIPTSKRRCARQTRSGRRPARERGPSSGASADGRVAVEVGTSGGSMFTRGSRFETVGHCDVSLWIAA